MQWPDWWADWLISKTPMLAELPWHGDVADIYNHEAAVIHMDRPGGGPDHISSLPDTAPEPFFR
jgi:hypothetical protein